MPPRVSIGLPVYNGAATLEETLRSWRAQELRDYELIVADNASTDGTSEIVARFAADDPRIRVIRRPETIPACDNFNTLVAEAKAPYFAWSAADDLTEPGFLKKTVEVLDGEPDVVLAFGQARLFGREGDERRRPAYSRHRFGLEPTPLRRAVNVLRRAHQYSVVYGVMRAEALRRTTLLDPRMGWISDVTLVLWLATLGKIRILPEVLFHTRRAPGNKERRGEDAAIYRGRVFHQDSERILRSMPLSEVEQRILIREFRLWCRKSQRPRPLWLRPKPIRVAHVAAQRAVVDALAWYHGV